MWSRLDIDGDEVERAGLGRCTWESTVTKVGKIVRIITPWML